MTIHELLQAAGLTANDEIPIWDVDGTGEPTKKITAQQLAAAVGALANLVTGVKGDKEGNYRHGNVNLTPANIGAVAKSGDTITGRLNINNSSTSGGGVRIWEDDEGGNISIYSPNGEEFQIDAVSDTELRCFSIRNGSYKDFSFNGLTGVLSASGGFEGVSGTSISSSLQIAASIAVNLSTYTRIECDWQCPGGRIHLSMPEKGVWYAATALNEDTTAATDYFIYGIKIRFVDSGFEVNYCGFKNMNTGAWTDRLDHAAYTLRHVYGYTGN